MTTTETVNPTNATNETVGSTNIGGTTGATGEPIMQFFAYEHLSDRLQAVSAPFGELAQQIVGTLPRNPERTMALRKLLEAKDAAVRALIAR